MKKGPKILLLLVLLGEGFVSMAQNPDLGQRQFAVDVIWGHPQNSFEENLGKPMPGIVISLGGQTPVLPLVLSTEIGWMGYGFDNFMELQFPTSTNATLPPSVVNVNTKNSIVLTNFVARIIPYQKVIAPYIEGILGFKFISTRIGVESDMLFNDESDIIINDDDKILTSTTYKSTALSYGIGAGVNIQVFEGKLGFHNEKSTIFLHVGAQYLFGSNADYLTPNSIQPIANTVSFEEVESNTNILIPQFGFRFGL